MAEIWRVGMAELKVAQPPDRLAVYGIGSCMVLVLWDPESQVGGLAHCMLPTAAAQPGGEGQPAKFCDTAVGVLLEAMQSAGAQRERVGARLVGGANMFSFVGRDGGPLTLGDRNAFTARETLRAWSLPIKSEDTGGDKGRSLELDPADGTLKVWSATTAPRWL